MISSVLSCTVRQAITLHGAIAAYRNEKLSAGDRICLAGVLRRIRKFGFWSDASGTFDIVPSSESPRVKDSGVPVFNPDGTQATIRVYPRESLDSSFPDVTLSPEERGAIFRLLLSIAEQSQASPQDMLQALEIGSWLGFDKRMDEVVRKASKVEPFLDEIED